MKRISLVIIISVMTALTLCGQTLTPKQDGRLWGFVDNNDAFVIKPKYTAVGEFICDYTWVNIGGKLKMEHLPDGGKWGVIDKQGNEVCPVDYDYVDLLNGTVVAVNKGGMVKSAHVNGGKWGYYDVAQKKEIVLPLYDQASVFTSNGVGWVQKDSHLSRRVLGDELKDKGGNLEDVVMTFCVNDELATQSLFDKYDKDGRWGLIDRNGKEVLPFEYGYVYGFEDQVTPVERQGKMGVVDISGKEVIPFNYDIVSCPYEGTVYWVCNGKKWQLIDKTGNMLTPLRYDEVFAFNNGVANVKKDDSIGLVNVNGKEIARTIYSEAPLEFGVSQFRPNRNGKAEYLSWLSHPMLGCVWINQDGKTLLSQSKAMFTINDKIPETLWDY